MKKKASLLNNISYNTVYQIFSIILPLITAPYIARVLGADKVGIYSKTHALANYFHIFAMLGVQNYGNRAIAMVHEDRAERSRVFCEIYALQLISSVLVLFSYLVFCIVHTTDYSLIYFLLALFVMSGVFDVNWFCYGCENFKLTTIRSTIIRLITLAAILLFVKGKEDLWKYTAILVTCELLSSLMVWPYVLKNIDIIKPKWDGIKKHIRPNLVLLWPCIAISLYNTMDKVILGMFSRNEEVAFYTNAETIVTIPYTIMLAIDNVTMPRASNLYAKNDKDQAMRLLDFVMLITGFLAVGMTFGVAGISDTFVPWFFGEEFTRCGYYVFLLAPTILIRGIAGALRTQYIIPTKRDRIYVISLTVGAVINLVIDLLLVPEMEAVGAIIGTLAAELAVAVIQFVMCRKEVHISGYLKENIIFLISGLIMYALVVSLNHINSVPILVILIQVGAGSCLYAALAGLYLYKQKRTYMKEMLKVFMN